MIEVFMYWSGGKVVYIGRMRNDTPLSIAKRTAQHKRYLEAYPDLREERIGTYETPGQACYVVKELNAKHQPWMYEKPLTDQIKRQRERAKRKAEEKARAPRTLKGNKPRVQKRKAFFGDGWPDNCFVVFGYDCLIRTRS